MRIPTGRSAYIPLHLLDDAPALQSTILTERAHLERAAHDYGPLFTLDPATVRYELWLNDPDAVVPAGATATLAGLGCRVDHAAIPPPADQPASRRLCVLLLRGTVDDGGPAGIRAVPDPVPSDQSAPSADTDGSHKAATPAG